MAFRPRYRGPDGQPRPWTLREVLQGKPIDRPTHPMVVHFPIAFYLGALALDVLSRVGDFPSAPLAATWALIGAFALTLVAVPTGLADRAALRSGSRARGLATRHMLLQLTAAALFVSAFALRWPDRHAPQAAAAWIALEGVGVLVLGVALDLGGQLVYRLGVRVSGAD